jgi:hypothetical protein
MPCHALLSTVEFMDRHNVLVVSIHHICSTCDEVDFSVHQLERLKETARTGKDYTECNVKIQHC